MTHKHFLMVEAIILIALNFIILRLYKKIRSLESAENDSGLNSKTLFNYLNPGTWMLRLPFPIYSSKRNNDTEHIIKQHNRLVYIYYLLIAFVLWHFTFFIE